MPNNGNKIKILIWFDYIEIYLKLFKGLPINKSLKILLSIKPVEVYRCDSVNSLKLVLNEIKNKFENITFGINNGVDQVKEHCISLRSEVQLAAEESIEQINCLADEFLTQINEYEAKCAQINENNFEVKKDFKKTVDELKQFYNQWTEYLKKPIICDKDILKANEIAEYLNRIGENQSARLYDFNFNENILFKFEKSLNKFNLGSIKVKSILSDENMIDLIKLCEFPENQKLNLIYKATKDGFKASSFHSKCDYKPNTLIIIKTTNGNIFGGYTEQDWSGFQFKNDQNAFIFSFINKENKKLKMKCLKPENAIFSFDQVGIVFGGFEADICIEDTSDIENNSFSRLSGQSYNSQDLSSLAGSYNFRTSEIEVYMKE
jgi:hypothetical protein